MTHIEQRSDFSAIWAVKNPVLNRGEVGWEEDTRRAKVGDGLTVWNSLLYANPGPVGPQGAQGPVGPTGSQGPTGPAGGATGAAGGDLAGTYPNPTIKGSVALTGSPTTTTQVVGTNNTTIATTAFVKSQSYAPLANPVFTGDPKAPTPATGDNDTSIATTAFVNSSITDKAPITRLFASGELGNTSAAGLLTVPISPALAATPTAALVLPNNSNYVASTSISASSGSSLAVYFRNISAGGAVVASANPGPFSVVIFK